MFSLSLFVGEGELGCMCSYAHILPQCGISGLGQKEHSHLAGRGGEKRVSVYLKSMCKGGGEGVLSMCV